MTANLSLSTDAPRRRSLAALRIAGQLGPLGRTLDQGRGPAENSDEQHD